MEEIISVEKLCVRFVVRKRGKRLFSPREKSSVEALGGGLYRVYFGVYGEGEAWNAADCALLPEQAANLYDQTPPRQGCAVIRSLGLDSQNGMTLSRLLIE